MKIIENKKLFGKINIIDVIVISCIIMLGIFAYYKIGKGSGKIVETSKYIFEYEFQKVTKEVANSIKIGDDIYDNEINKKVGKVIDIEVKPYEFVVIDKINNKYVNSTVEGYYNVLLKLENELFSDNFDLQTTDGYVIKIGKHVYSRGNIYAGGGYIANIERQVEHENF